MTASSSDQTDQALAPQTHAHLSAHHGDFANFAEVMVKTHKGRFDPVFWAFTQKYTPKDSSVVVDLGTGPGLLLPELKRNLQAKRVIGLEAQPEMLARAKEVEADGIELLAHDLSISPWPGLQDDSVDVVVASVLLHELLVPTQTIDEAVRVLRPGGVFIVYDWVRQPLSTYFGGRRPEEVGDFQHFSEHCRMTLEDLSWLLEQSGLKVQEAIARRGGKFGLVAAQKPEST